MEQKITMQTHTEVVQTQTVDRLGRTAQNHSEAPLRWADNESDYASNGQERYRGDPAHRHSPTIFPEKR